MKPEDKQALIEYCKEVQGNNPESSDAYKVISIALAALTAQPVAYVHPAYLQPGALGFDASVGCLAPAQIPLFTRPAPAVSLAELVPDGWQLVPVEPTEEMIAAADQFMDGLSRLSDAYEAMLAAVPTPPQ